MVFIRALEHSGERVSSEPAVSFRDKHGGIWDCLRQIQGSVGNLLSTHGGSMKYTMARRGPVFQLPHCLYVLIDQNRISIRINNHKASRASRGFVCF